MSKTQNCERCIYWKRDKEEIIGECRILPPAFGVPKTKATYWCGRWREKPRSAEHDDQGLSWFGHEANYDRGLDK
jgi:hypothetical protein